LPHGWFVRPPTLPALRSASPWKGELAYSQRSETMGSTRAARRAGM